MDERHRRSFNRQGPRRRGASGDGGRQAVGLYPVRPPRHRRSGTGRGGEYRAVLMYVLATQTLVVVPIVGYAIAPHQAARSLKAAETWLEQHNRMIVITVSLIFGVWFLYKGLTGLLGQLKLFSRK